MVKDKYKRKELDEDPMKTQELLGSKVRLPHNMGTLAIKAVKVENNVLDKETERFLKLKAQDCT